MIIVANSRNDKQVAMEFLHSHGVPLVWSDDFNALGNYSNGKLIGVVAYNAFNGKCCAMHNAGEGNWITRHFLRAAFHYPFVSCALNYIIVTVAGDNTRALKLDKHLGFRVMHRIRDGWDDGIDTVVMSMAKHECRYIEQEKGNELKAA